MAGIVNKVNSPGTLKKRPVRNDLGTGLNGPLPKGYVSKADSRLRTNLISARDLLAVPNIVGGYVWRTTTDFDTFRLAL